MLFTTLIATPIALFFGVLGALKSEGYVDHALTVVTSDPGRASVVRDRRRPDLPAGDLRVPCLACRVADQPVGLDLRAAEAADPARCDARARRRPVSAPDDPREHGRGAAERLRHARAAARALARRVVFRHALPNAVATTIQATALNLVFLAGGVVVVETGLLVSWASATRSSRRWTCATSLSSRRRSCCSRRSTWSVNLIADILVILVTPRFARRRASRPRSGLRRPCRRSSPSER